MEGIYSRNRKLFMGLKNIVLKKMVEREREKGVEEEMEEEVPRDKKGA